MTNEETTPQRARRMGREYADTYHDRWSHEGRKWIRFAFARGYQTACENIADDIDGIESDSFDEFVAEVDEILNHYDTRQEAAA